VLRKYALAKDIIPTSKVARTERPADGIAPEKNKSFHQAPPITVTIKKVTPRPEKSLMFQGEHRKKHRPKHSHSKVKSVGNQTPEATGGGPAQ
jgi:hypothetical protein